MIYELLYDWQKRLVDRLKSRRSYGLFLDMGLGKTPISLALAEVNKCDKVLIVTINSKATEKSSIDGSWLWWASKSSIPYALHDKSVSDHFSSPQETFILNYEYLADRKKIKTEKGVVLRQTISDFIESCKSHKVALIIDESHKMKDTSSLQTKCITDIWKKLSMKSEGAYLYLLTGTPFTQGYMDLYSQLKILGMPMNKTQFKDEFCVMGQIRGLLAWQQPIIGYKNIDKLYDLVHQYAITIKSEEVIDLPEQVFVTKSYGMSNSFRLYLCEKLKGSDIDKQLKARGLEPQHTDKPNLKYPNPFFRNIDYPNFTWTAETPSQFWLRARQLSIGFQGNADTYQWYDDKRLNMLKRFLSENEDNYLLFYSFTPELIRIFDICTELNYNIDIYSGEIKSTDNYEHYSHLSSSERLTSTKNILIANWQSGSTGMNFQAYHKCIIFDLPAFKDWEQGLKRIHRTGQKETCIYYVFRESNFLDDGMMKAINERREYTKDTFESDLERVQDIIQEK